MTMAGLRLSTLTHQTSPRPGKGSPVVVTVLLGHPGLLVLPPAPLIVGNIPAVPVDVPPDLRLDLLRLEQSGQQTGPGGAATLRFFVRKGEEVVGQGDSDLHGRYGITGGIPRYLPSSYPARRTTTTVVSSGGSSLPRWPRQSARRISRSDSAGALGVRRRTSRGRSNP